MLDNEHCSPWHTSHMSQRVAHVRFLARPFVLKLPFAREEVYELGVPVKRGHAFRKGCDITALGEVVYEDANSTGKEGFRARGQVEQCLRTVSV